MIPLKINNKNLCEIFEPALDITGWTEKQIQDYSIKKLMFPTEVSLTSETYSTDTERTADYELEDITIVNRKSKAVFTWSIIPAEYVENLLSFLNYTYNFKNTEGKIVPVKADHISVEYIDFIGPRVIDAYLGQTLDGTLVEYEGKRYWQNFRIAFPER